MEESQLKKFANLTLKDMRRGSQPNNSEHATLQKRDTNSLPVPGLDLKKPEMNSSIGMDETTVGPSYQE